MANGKKTVGQILIESLTKISNELEKFVKLSDRLDERSQVEDKTSYEFRLEIFNKIKELNDKSHEFTMTLKDLITKLDIKEDKSVEMINKLQLDLREHSFVDYEKIKNIIQNTAIQTKLAEECESCPLIKHNEKWIKWLKKIIVFLGLALLTIMGLNVMNYIKLPGLG